MKTWFDKWPNANIGIVTGTVSGIVAFDLDSEHAVEYAENEAPRMYYENQLQKHLGRSSEVCEVVVKVPDSYYDIGFYRDENGNLTPVFDDYGRPGLHAVAKQGSGPIRDTLGAKHNAPVEHWNGLHKDGETEQTLHSIGKLLQGISKHQAMRVARSNGHMVTGSRVDEEGNVHLTVSVN